MSRQLPSPPRGGPLGPGVSAAAGLSPGRRPLPRLVDGAHGIGLGNQARRSPPIGSSRYLSCVTATRFEPLFTPCDAVKSDVFRWAEDTGFRDSVLVRITGDERTKQAGPRGEAVTGPSPGESTSDDGNSDRKLQKAGVGSSAEFWNRTGLMVSQLVGSLRHRGWYPCGTIDDVGLRAGRSRRERE